MSQAKTTAQHRGRGPRSDLDFITIICTFMKLRRRELNPGLPRDRRKYWRLYYSGSVLQSNETCVHVYICLPGYKGTMEGARCWQVSSRLKSGDLLRNLFCSVVERLSCKLKVLGSIPSEFLASFLWSNSYDPTWARTRIVSRQCTTQSAVLQRVKCQDQTPYPLGHRVLEWRSLPRTS